MVKRGAPAPQVKTPVPLEVEVEGPAGSLAITIPPEAEEATVVEGEEEEGDEVDEVVGVVVVVVEGERKPEVT